MSDLVELNAALDKANKTGVYSGEYETILKKHKSVLVGHKKRIFVDIKLKTGKIKKVNIDAVRVILRKRGLIDAVNHATMNQMNITSRPETTTKLTADEAFEKLIAAKSVISSVVKEPDVWDSLFGWEIPVAQQEFVKKKTKSSEYEVGDWHGFSRIIDIVDRTYKGVPTYLCRCICGTEFTKKYDKGGSRDASCGCIKIEDYELIPASFIREYIRSAGSRKIRWFLHPKDMWDLWTKQNGKCAKTGADLEFLAYDESDDDYGFDLASLDRIDSDGDYSKDNVQWVQRIYNLSKSDKSDEAMQLLGEQLTMYKIKTNKAYAKTMLRQIKEIVRNQRFKSYDFFS